MPLHPETSLIPSVLALSSFFIDNYPHISWFPYWYLGNPFSYLSGPVVPGLLLIFSKTAPLSLYNLYLSIIIFCTLLGGIGVYFLVKGWGKEEDLQVSALFSALLYVILPFSWLGLYYQSGLKNIAFALVPFIFIIYRKFLNKSQIHHYFLLALLTGICLLVTVNIFLTIIVGFIAVLLSSDSFFRQERGLDKRALWAWREEKIFKSFILILLILCLVTYWYTPRFWWVLLTNPSFGGIPLWNLILKLFQYLLNFVPLALAILIVKWKFMTIKPRGVLLFSALFSLSFFFLTFARLLADPDFVTDWIGFIPELQFGFSLLAGSLAGWIINRRRISQTPKFLITGLISVSITVIFIVSVYLVYNIFSYPKTDYQADIIDILKSHKIDREARIFLSGSDVFWINAYLPLSQVRGGNDSASIHPFWSHGAYQIREGESEQLTADWLKIFGSSYILVHHENSRDMYHDYKQLEKFKNLPLIVDNNGDLLYKIPDISIARIADKSLIGIPKPKNGADAFSLNKYAASLKKPVSFKFTTPDTISLKTNLAKNEAISLAVTYDPSWKIADGKGNLISDSLGNILIIPDKSGDQEFVLTYQKSSSDFIAPLVLIIVLVLSLLKFDSLYPKIRNKLPKIHLGLREEDDEY